MPAKIQGTTPKNPRALDESHRPNSQYWRGFSGDRGSKIQKSTILGSNDGVEGLDFCGGGENHTASMVGKHAPDYLFFWIFGFLTSKHPKTRASTGKTVRRFRPNFHPKIQGIFGFLPRGGARLVALNPRVCKGNRSIAMEP